MKTSALSSQSQGSGGAGRGPVSRVPNTRRRLRNPGVGRVGEATWRFGRHLKRLELREAVKGRLPWGGAGPCALTSVPFPEPEVMLKASLECPFEPLNGVQGGKNLNIIFFLRVRSQRPISTAAAAGTICFLISGAPLCTTFVHSRTDVPEQQRTSDAKATVG